MYVTADDGVRTWTPALADVREPGPVHPRRQAVHERLIGLDPAAAEVREAGIVNGTALASFAHLPLGMQVAAVNRAADARTAHTRFTSRPAPQASFVPAASVVADGPQAPNGPNGEPLSSCRGGS